MTNQDETGGGLPRDEAEQAQPRQEQARPGEPPGEPSREVVYGLSYTLSDEEAQRSFDEEDQRWSAANQLKDWLWLLLALLLWVGWTLAIYFVEPGLR